MKYFPLVLMGLWRRPARTIFTLVSIVAAFVLFGTLQGIDSSFSQLIDRGRLNVLVTRNPAGLPLPIAAQSQIEAVPGVAAVIYRSQLIGYYQSLRNIVVGLPVDPKSFFLFNPEFVLPGDQLAAFMRIRTAAVVTPSLAQRLHWKIGDHVPFHALSGLKKDGTADWTFDIVGIFDAPGNPVREQPLLLMNFSYFDAARATDNGTVQLYSEKIADASKSADIATAIDNLFANSAYHTQTETEKASMQSLLAQIGDLDFFVDAIVGAAFFTLLLVTGNTMMQSFRERLEEFAVMKALGFTDLGISAIVMSEAVTLCATAALAGLCIARLLLPILSRTAGGQIPGIHLPLSVFVGGLSASIVMAAASALPAAWRAKRLSVIEALAGY
jgi:putative ABC transport system permease protein